MQHNGQFSAGQVRRGASALVIALLLLVSWALILQAQTSVQDQVRKHMQTAEGFLKERNIEAAAREFQAVLAQHPNNLDARVDLGVLAYFQHDCSLAIPNLREALSQRPSLFKAQALLGLCEERSGNSSGAEKDLAQSISHLESWNLMKLAGTRLIEIYYQRNDLNRAARVLAELQRSHPTDVDILFMAYRIHTELAETARDALALVAPDSARMHELMAEQFVNRGDAAAAVNQYEEALAKNPALPGLHYELGEAIMQSSTSESSIERAEREFRAALVENPRNAGAEAKLGRIAYSRGNLAQAEQEYRRALALQPGQVDALKGMAAIDARRGQTQLAIRYLLQASQSAPLDGSICYRLASFYRKLGRESDANREMIKFERLRAIKNQASLAQQRSQQGSNRGPSQEN